MPILIHQTEIGLGNMLAIGLGNLLASAWPVLTQLQLVSKCHKLEEFDAHGEVKSGRFERKQI